MKASTLFIITIAILLGVTAVVGAKYAGVFEPKALVAETPPPVPRVLVARQNLFEGIAITTGNVRLRPLHEHERAHYDRNPEKYLPPLLEAAHMRVMARSVEADQPLLREYFQDQATPTSVSERLEPYMRAVNVSVPKSRSAGGLLRLGEHVDVHLTTSICDGRNCEQTITRTAVIARDLKIIVKRNNLWTVMARDPGDTVNFTLQANPYRAALIEFAKEKGELALVPSPASQVKATKVSAPRSGGIPSFSDPESDEYRDEDTRVAAALEGELTVGEADLERIFKLKPIQVASAVPPTRVVRFSGLQLQGTTLFSPEGSPQFLRGQVPQAQADSGAILNQGGGMGYQFNRVTPAAKKK